MQILVLRMASMYQLGLVFSRREDYQGLPSGCFTNTSMTITYLVRRTSDRLVTAIHIECVLCVTLYQEI